MQHGSRRTSATPGQRGKLEDRETAAPVEPRWRSLLSSVRAIQMELKRRRPEHAIGLSGNPSAPEAALLVTELRLGRKLPPSYREFLGFSDGWTNFFNGASLLGTGELGRAGVIAEGHERLLARGRLLPFGADRGGSSLFAFDTSVRLGDGELGVVAWVGGLGIDCRCFTGFLATVLQLCRAELSTAKAADPQRSELSGTAANATRSGHGAESSDNPPPSDRGRGWLDVG
jgi:hypothetical protein